MRETCRVRSRSTSTAGAVQVRVRAIALRISPDNGTPAAAALARQTADSAGDMRTATKTVRRSPMGMRRHGRSGGRGHRLRSLRERGLRGDRRGPPLASPRVIHGVCWLRHLNGARQPPGERAGRPPAARILGRRSLHTVYGEARPERCQPPESTRLPKGSSAVPETDRPPPTGPPSPPAAPSQGPSASTACPP